MAFDERAYMKKYLKEYYKRNAEKLKARSRVWYENAKSDPEFKIKVKLRRELRHFGRPMNEILAKTSGKCPSCGKEAQLVHHLDEDGRTNEVKGLPPGHDPERQEPLCRRCHINQHRAKLMANRRTRANGFWARNFSSCTECHTTKVRHNSHGLCMNCWARSRRHDKEARVKSLRGQP